MKIFISYEPDADQRFVDRLSEALRNKGITPSCINLKLMFGDQVIEKADLALKGCDRIIVVLSKAYNSSKWLEKELFAFQMRETLQKTQLILAVSIEPCHVPAMLEDRLCSFQGIPFEQAFENFMEKIAYTKKVFVVMKFGDARLDSAYDLAIKPVIEEFKFLPVRIDSIQDSGKISTQILNGLSEADIVLADLTGERPNCYFEAGYACALEKEMILTIQKNQPVHFDLADNRFITWETEKELKRALQERFKAIRGRNRGKLNDP